MKEKSTRQSSVSPGNKGDSAKLVSLLALATGAVAMPQTCEADIIVTDFTNNPVRVGYLSSPSFTTDNLPGIAQLRFRFVQQGTTSSTSLRAVLGSQAGGYVRLKTNASLLVHVPAGMAWGQIAGFSYHSGTAGKAIFGAHLPNSYNNEYYAFRFKDSTQGNAFRYGWVEASLFNGNLSSSEGPEVSIWRYAFDTTGAQLPTGQVPEPAPAAFLALAALTLGAKGLRSWRQNRQPESKS